MELQRRLERADAKNSVARHRSSALIFFCVSLTIHNYSLGSRTVIWWKVCDYGKTLQRSEIRRHKGIISMRNKMQAYSPKFHSSAPSSWWKVAWLSCILSGKRNNLRESFYALDDPLEQSCICPLVRFTLFTFPEEGESSSDWILLKTWTIGLPGWASPDGFSQDHSPPIRFQEKNKNEEFTN